MSISTGDKVSWNSSGGTARGIVRQIVRDGNVPNIPVKVTGSKEEPAARIEIVDDEGKPTGEMVGHKLSTLRKSAVDVVKARYANDIFTTEMEARARSMDLGLNGATHVHEYDGQAVYMPGESHRAYLEFYRASEGMEVAEGPESERMDSTERDERERLRLDALRAVVAEIMCKADYQGEEVTLNKPFRLPSGSSKKFGVYVKDGDKTKKVTFGSPDMEIRRDDPDARRNFRARHNCDTATDKTSARYWSCRMWEDDVSVSEMTKTEFEAYGEVTKMDDDQRIVYGYASVISKGGEPIVDRQGDIITAEELEKAASEFMLGERNGLTMHKGEPTTTIIHSFPMTNETKKAYEIESPYEAWLIAVKVHDDETWAKVKEGELKDFSIGGAATRRDV